MNAESIIECVPNFSEGMDEEKVRAIVASMKVDGVRLLDWSRDATHNRSVVTIAGSPDAVVESAVRGVGKAAQLIDLTQQSGVHPRIGAADVVPFVPVSGISVAECAMLARQAGLQIWRRYGVPVYFYGAAATRPDRVQLEDVRRGQFEGLREAALRDAMRRPDVGGPELHSKAGASAVGARSFLIAYNLYIQHPGSNGSGQAPILPQQTEIASARAIARDIRDLRVSNGGLQGVKAIGVMANGRAQISMNITDYQLTPMGQVHAAVSTIARRHGVEVSDGELIGLIPEAAFEPDSDWVRQTLGFNAEEKVLERKLHRPMEWPVS
ncbi:glutamate formiminotransferase [Granulicella aggregans]|jgi:glutamate formiminotransferase|uniref:glutamate formimidoyltransferase n=1 Tax=Granulicella aggregans TaxID=474949 RepID=A0A7W8E3C7_9BACT|nr:glutamate formimidoyltransferase [Granulicella aggregans]MBB5057843.1 glutamate formiminotransferase [Granulicella aggregans]